MAIGLSLDMFKCTLEIHVRVYIHVCNFIVHQEICKARKKEIVNASQNIL